MKRLAIVTLLAVALLGGCSTAPKKDLNVARLQADLERLESGELGPYAATERAAAAAAVRDLETLASTVEEVREHYAYIAQRRIEIARRAAEYERDRQIAEDLEDEYQRLLLTASLQEAERARREAERLRMENAAALEEAERARAEAAAALQARAQSDREAMLAQQERDQARRLADAREREAAIARREAEVASQAAQELRRQLNQLTSQRTDRGLVMTLGDVLFETGEADLKPETLANLNKVVAFIDDNAGKPVRVEGHTDSRGSSAFNLQLSQRRGGCHA